MTALRVIIKSADGDKEYLGQPGQNVLELIQDAGINFQAPCGGDGRCGKCTVFVHEGDGSGLRLACRTAVTDHMILELGSPAPMLIEESAISSPYPADKDGQGLGIALDIGTTTLACRLFDLENGELLASAAQINPQAPWGADVISRIDASVEGKLSLMKNSLFDAIAQMITELTEKAGRSVADINSFYAAGNTVMQHIACGLPPDSIGVNPFTPLSLFGDAHELKGFPCPVWFAPCIASYVGGDITAGMITASMHTAERPQILVDLGTNGEIALGDKNGISCCATAAGPVFEGANIRFGMAAMPGAISEAWEDNGKLVFSVIGDEPAKGICGTGIIDIAAFMYARGIFDATGYLLSAEECPEYANYLGKEDNQQVFYIDDSHEIYITQRDIRNIQLGKSAVLSGVLVLLAEAGLSYDDIDHLDIAGGFGKRLNLESAATLGIIPRQWLPRAYAIGNSSVEGASAALLSKEARQDLLELWNLTTYIELSTSARFNEYFVDNMMFEE